jgi:hypothetical protein
MDLFSAKLNCASSQSSIWVLHTPWISEIQQMIAPQGHMFLIEFSHLVNLSVMSVALASWSEY